MANYEILWKNKTPSHNSYEKWTKISRAKMAKYLAVRIPDPAEREIKELALAMGQVIETETFKVRCVDWMTLVGVDWSSHTKDVTAAYTTANYIPHNGSSIYASDIPDSALEQLSAEVDAMVGVPDHMVGSSIGAKSQKEVLSTPTIRHTDLEGRVYEMRIDHRGLSYRHYIQ